MFLTEEIRVLKAKNLFVQWVEDNSIDDLAQAEHEFMKFASDEIKIQYNDFYGLYSGDAFYFEVTD